MVRAGANAKEIIYPQISVKGLGNYDRNSGYTGNSVKLEWKTATFDYDRGTKISVDTQDNAESMNIAFGMAGAELMRTKVAPEADAYTFAKIAGTTGITKVSEDYTGAEEFLSALLTAITKMDEDEVPMESRILFITPTLVSLADDMDTIKSREVLKRFSQIISVPQSRMYTSITLHDGKNSYGYEKTKAAYTLSKDTSPQPGKTYYTKESEGNYKAVSNPSGTQVENYEMTTKPAKDVNFLCVEKSAAVTAMDQYIKYFSPDQDQDGDSHVFKYRNNNLYGHVYENKTAGVYVSHKDN